MEHEIKLSDTLSAIITNNINAEEELDALVDELRNIRARIAELEAEEEAIKDLLKEYLAQTGQDTLLGANWRITWKEHSRRSLRTKDLEAEEPELYLKYLKVTSYKRFDIN